MPISDNDDTQELNKQCVLAVHEHKIPALIIQLERRGITITEDEIRSRFELWSDAWRIYDSSKSNCFLCRATRTSKEELCVCFNDVRINQYHDPHDLSHITSLAPDAIVETYQCKKCGNLAHIKARHVSSQHRKRGYYKTPRLCMDCYEATKEVEQNRFYSPSTSVAVDWQNTDATITRST